MRSRSSFRQFGPPSRRRLLAGGGAVGVAAVVTTLTGSAWAALPGPPTAKPNPTTNAGLPLPPNPRAARPLALSQVTPVSGPGHRALTLDNINTGERLSVTYMENGHYLSDALAAINRLMRDRRSGDVAPIDPALLDLMCDIHAHLETTAPVQLISGYRAPDTNTRLSRTNGAVAKKSYHTRGMAADIAIPDRTLGDLRRVALSLGRGGVGFYPKSGFVHVDVGPPRAW